MIRKLRIRFIAVATLSAAIVIIAVSCGILLTNRRQTLQNIDGMLSLLAQNEGRFPNAPNGDAPSDSTQDADTAKPVPPAPRGGYSPIRSPETPFRTRFFMAAADTDGNILRLNTDNLASLSEAEARAYVTAALASGRIDGRADVYYYRIAPDAEDGTRRVVVFLNCEVELAAMRTLARTCVLISALSIFLVTLLSFALSGAAIRPFVLNLARQKEFVTGASHELKTPIAIIQSNVEVIELTEGESKWTRNIRAQSERLIRLAGELTMLSREDEETKKSMTAVDFSACARRAVAACEERAALAKLTLCADITDGVTVQGDGIKLDTLCSVLLDNAVRYTSGDTIAVALRKKGEKAVLTCANRCAPLGKAQLARLFDRFYRADEARSGDGGFGLGLSIAAAIVRAHGGKITTAQDADGLLTFTVVL